MLIKGKIMKKIAVYGDSIAFGCGSGDKSWFDMLENQGQKFKFAFNGARICDSLDQIKKCEENFDQIYLAIGVNDLFSINSFHYDIFLEQYENLITYAKQKANQVIIQGLLPVIIHTNSPYVLPNEVDPINLIIESFNFKLKEHCQKRSCIFIDAFAEFIKLDLKDYYSDDIHLSDLGQIYLLGIYNKNLTD